MGVHKLLLNYVYYLCPSVAEDHNVISSLFVHLPIFSHRVKAKLKVKAVALENGLQSIFKTKWLSLSLNDNQFVSIWKDVVVAFTFARYEQASNANEDAVHVDEWVHIPLSVILTSTFFNQVWRWTISVQSLISNFSFNWFIFYFNGLLESFRINYQTWIYNQKNIFPSVLYDLRQVCIVFGRNLLAFIYLEDLEMFSVDVLLIDDITIIDN